MELSQKLADRTRERIIETLSLGEVEAAGGGPLVPLAGSMGPVGACRVWSGEPLAKLVSVSIGAPALGLDSHMVFAFAPTDSAVPHFTLDSVLVAGSYAFHLDLIPRVDLGASLSYADGVYGPLTEHFQAARRIDGLSEAQLSPRQLALMSPWMLAHRATEAAFARIDAAVDAYLEHWLALLTGGLPAGAAATVEPARLPQRDQRHRDALFSPDVDPVWGQVERLIGAEAGVKIRDILRSLR